MEQSALMAISPLDGRYFNHMNHLRAIFSEYGLIKFRIKVEVEWFRLLNDEAHLKDIPPLSVHAKHVLKGMAENVTLADAMRVKHIESGIHHDVKAVEYFIKEKIANNEELMARCELIHFGCTSEDINNLAYGLMLTTARNQCLLPSLHDLLAQMKRFAIDYADLAMLSHTHGQPATPTTVGKEFANFVARLQRQISQLTSICFLGKLNGASGNYNALAFAYPELNWQDLSRKFVTELGLTWNAYTTQIEPHDYMAELFMVVVRINSILLDFNRDMWGYIAINYMKQKSFANEVGSSTMPHKINPIDFENAEGNLGIANALLEHMATKLPVSRWQRDLSDSTVLRNIGVALGHTLLAYQSTYKGLTKLEPNQSVIAKDLDQHWEILGEAIQTVMRRYGLEQPYEQLKAFTRGKRIDQTSLHAFVNGLTLADDVKQELLALVPGDYTGYAGELAKRI